MYTHTDIERVNSVDLEYPAALSGDGLTAEFATHVIKLVKIMDGMLRYLYPIKRPELLARTLGEEYEMTVVAELGEFLFFIFYFLFFIFFWVGKGREG